jgi:hypothetical protein
MPPKKGEFPARPPTLAEALYEGKEIGTRPENHEEILKSLNLDALKTEQDNEKDLTTKTVVKKEVKKENKKPVVHQVDGHIDTPLPMEVPSKIDSKYILPNQCEAITNLQMNYILRSKSNLVKSILKSRTFSSFIFVIISTIAYRQIGDYFTDYTFRNGIWIGIKSLFSNSYFTNDLFTFFYLVFFLIAGSFTLLRFISSPLQEEASNVPSNFEKYFNIDFNEYAALQNIEKNYNKLNKSDKELVKYVKDNTFCIVYREAPVAFLVVKPENGDTGKNLKITSFAVRAVYIKAELLKDLIAMMFKKFLINENDNINSISVELYSFEEFDINIFKRAGFYRQNVQSLGFFLSTLFGITKDTYVFETDSIEF